MNEIECTKCIYNINNECKIGGWAIPKVGCPDGKAKPMTNADRIRSMSDEELVSVLACPPTESSFYCAPSIVCDECILNWLKQECDDNGT